MTLTTYRSPAARALHAALDLATRFQRSMRSRERVRAQALYVLDDAALRDLGIVHAEFESYAAEAAGQAPRSYLRTASVDANPA
jgi:hypothetical protein